MARAWDTGSVLDLVGDEVVREILALTSVEPRSADDLSDRCAASGPTVYRRLDALCGQDMLAEAVAYDDDGNHYQTYECRLQEARLRVDAGSLALDVRLAEAEGSEGDGAGSGGGSPDDDAIENGAGESDAGESDAGESDAGENGAR